MQIQSARVLVTGGGSGIGLATATLLAQRGAAVAITGRREDVLRRSAERIGATPFVADVRDEKQVIALIPRVIEALLGYNVLINNAGIGRMAPLLESSAADMRTVWETNVLGAMLVGRESAKYFVTQRMGHIVNIGSTAAQRGFPGGTAYAGSKFAVSAMTECWRAELRTANVRVTQVNPSEVVTDFFESAGERRRSDDVAKLHAEDIAHAILGVLELQDRALVTDITLWATNPPRAR